MARPLRLIEIKDDFEPLPTAEELWQREGRYNLVEFLRLSKDAAIAGAQALREFGKAAAALSSKMSDVRFQSIGSSRKP